MTRTGTEPRTARREPATSHEQAGAKPADHRERLLHGLPVTERQLQLAGVSTVVLEGGIGEPIILLHGPGESAVKWLRILPDLLRTHRVIAPDLPGHGASEVGDGRLDADHVRAWLGALIESTCSAPPTLLGHVIGGAIAARFAVRHGDRIHRLVLSDSLGLARFRPSPRFFLDMVRFMARPTERTYTRFMRQCSYDLDRLRDEMGPRWEPFVAYNVTTAQAPSSKAVGRLMRTVGLPRIPRQDLARISVPTALIWGRQDRAIRLPVAQAASDRYGWPLFVIEECADDPARDKPVEFLEALRSAMAGDHDTA
jgi:pimeloyl-ACP methyl ester carboxylesterase